MSWDESEILTLPDNKINELHDIFTNSKILDFPLKGDNDNENAKRIKQSNEQ